MFFWKMCTYIFKVTVFCGSSQQYVSHLSLLFSFIQVAKNSPVQSRYTPATMITPQTRSLLVENIFWILTYSFTLMKLMNVTRPSKKKIQCLVKLNNSTTVCVCVCMYGSATWMMARKTSQNNQIVLGKFITLKHTTFRN